MAATRVATAVAADALLLVASVALSWTVVQTMFTLRYARLYYGHPAGGIDFNQDAQPCYTDSPT